MKRKYKRKNTCIKNCINIYHTCIWKYFTSDDVPNFSNPSTIMLCGSIIPRQRETSTFSLHRRGAFICTTWCTVTWTAHGSTLPRVRMIPCSGSITALSTRSLSCGSGNKARTPPFCQKTWGLVTDRKIRSFRFFLLCRSAISLWTPRRWGSILMTRQRGPSSCRWERVFSVTILKLKIRTQF